MENRLELKRITKPWYLDKSSPKVDTPRGLKTELLEYQKASVYKILSLEASRKLTPKGCSFKFTPDVYSPCCILAEPFGAGKTIIILATLLHRPVLTCRKEPCNFLLGDLSMRNFQSVDQKFEDLTQPKKVYRSEVIKEYRRFIFPSIIIVAPSVVGYWKDTIEKLTDLRYFLVANVRELRDFHNKYQNNPSFVNFYDIILIKNGTISSNAPVNWEAFHGIEKSSLQYSIPRIMSKILEKVACNWLIYDDYDVVASPATFKINSLYTIFVSATQYCFAIHGTMPDKYDSISTLLNSEYSYMNLGKMYKDSFFNSLIVRSEESFIKSCFSLPKIRVFTATYKCYHDRYLKLIHCFQEDKVSGVLEAINAEALRTALEIIEEDTAGEFAKDSSAVFKKILYKEWNTYEEKCILLQEIKKVEEVAKSLPPHPGAPSTKEMETLKESLARSAKQTQRSNQGSVYKRVSLGKITPQFQSKELFVALGELRCEAEKAKNNSKRVLERVRENLSGGECPVCCSELSSVVITQCCHLVVCEVCLMKAFRMTREGSSMNIVGMCPQCRAKVDLKKDIIYINGEQTIKEIMQKKDIEIQLVESTKCVVRERPEDIPERNQKLKALYDIIAGYPPENTKEIPYGFENVLFGMNNIEPPENKKVLVFASFEETLDILTEFLGEYKLPFLRLSGDYKRKDLTIKKFKESQKSICMLANSNIDCSGIHLPETTDIVFFHNIFNEAVKNQIIGRAQRMGRKYNLNVWFLLYHGEAPED